MVDGNMKKREDDMLLENFFNRTFFETWKRGETESNFGKIELMITPECNLGCKYCYIHRYKKDLYPEDIRDRGTILKNLEMVLDWLIDNKYKPEIDIFSGDPLSQQIGIDALELIYERYKNIPEDRKISSIMIPTNYTFLLDDELTEKIKDIIRRLSEIGIKLKLSASFDGAFLESKNRPMIPSKFLGNENIVSRDGGVDPRKEEYYNKLFEFNREFRYGFHPMVYSEGIEHWEENFLWFQEKFKEFGIPFFNIYLLEVRNTEWSKDQMKKFGDFIDFLVKWTYKKLGYNKERFMEFLFDLKGYNMLSSPLHTTGRGLGCSIQSMMYVRLGDLKIVPCHRTMYPGYEYGEFEILKDNIVGIKSENPELAIGVYSFESDTAPYCDTCLIKSMCSKGCLGSQLEETGDMFTPIPSVCELEHRKLEYLIKSFDDVDLLDDIMLRVNEQKRYTLEKLKEMIGLEKR